MSNLTYAVTIYAVKRERSSVNGNPAFTLHTDKGFFRTQSDSSCAFDVNESWADQAAIIKVTRAGRVWSIETV